MANEINVKLTLDEKGAVRSLEHFEREARSTAKSTEKAFSAMDVAVGAFAANIASAAIAKGFSAIADGISGVVEASKELEVIETQFKTIIGSTEGAQKQLRELQDFAATTPFQLPGLALATRQLLSFGVEGEKIIPTLRQLGDLAAGTGAEIDELTIPFGRLISTQKLTLVELDKFADRGINIYKELADSTGISLKNIRDEISKGTIPFEEFTDALNRLTGEGGTFFQATQAQSKTLAGVLSTLNDNFFNLQSAIGDAFKPILLEGAKELTLIVQDLTQAVRENGPAITKTFSTLANLLVIQPSKFFVDLFGGGDASVNISQVTAELNKLNIEADRIVKRQQEKKEDTLYNSFIGRAEQDKEDLAVITARIKALRGELSNARADAKTALIDLNRGADTDITPKVGETKAQKDPKSDPRVIQEQKVQAEIAMLREQAALEEQERELRKKEQKEFLTEEEISELHEIEEQKLLARKDAEIAKIELIEDSQQRERELRKTHAQYAVQQEKLRTKQEIDEMNRREQRKRAIMQVSNQALGNFIQAGLTLSKQGSSEYKALATADAIRQTYVAANNALSTKAPWPLPAVFAASAVALGLANVAKIQSFQSGGVVGGFSGATAGGDNTVANVRTGEMVLNAGQQRELFDFANGRRNNNNEEMMLLKEAVAQPIVVMIDNKEVARAVRTAREEGMAV